MQAAKNKTYLIESREFLKHSFPRISCDTINFVFRHNDFSFTEAFNRLTFIAAQYGTVGNNFTLPEDPSIRVFIKRERTQNNKQPRIKNADLINEVDLIPELNQKRRAPPRNEPKEIIELLDSDTEDEEEKKEDMIECKVCYEEFDAREMNSCGENNEHLVCKDCIRRHVSEQLDGNGSLKFKCIGDVGCDCEYPLAKLEAVLPADLNRRINEKTFFDIAQIEGMWQCPGGCGFVGFVDQDFPWIVCTTCNKQYCTRCNDRFHVGKTCDEVRMERVRLKDPKHRAHEAMSRACKRFCPHCNQDYMKSDGCNNIKCSKCKLLSCYLCGDKIAGYSHFCNHPSNDKMCHCGKPCQLWTSTDKMNQIDREKRREAGRKVLAEAGYTDEKEILSILGSPEKIRHLNDQPPDQNHERAAQVPAARVAGPPPPQNAHPVVGLNAAPPPNDPRVVLVRDHHPDIEEINRRWGRVYGRVNVNPEAGFNEAPPPNDARAAQVPAAAAEGFRFEPAQVPAARAFAFGNAGPPPPPQNAHPAAGLNLAPPQNDARAAQVPNAGGFRFGAFAFGNAGPPPPPQNANQAANLNLAPPQNDARAAQVPAAAAEGFRFEPAQVPAARAFAFGNAGPPPPPQDANPAAGLNAAPPQNDARAALVPNAGGFRFGAFAFGNAGPPPPQNANPAAGLNAAPPQNNVGAAQVPAAAARGFRFGPAQVPAERPFAFGNAGPPAAGLNAAPPQNDARPAQVPNAGGFRFGALAFGNAGPPPPPPRNANPAAGLNVAPPQNDARAAQVPAAAAEGFRFNGAPPPQNVNPAAGLNVQPPRNDIAAHEPPNGALGQNHQLGIEELLRRLNRLRPYELN